MYTSDITSSHWKTKKRRSCGQ